MPWVLTCGEGGDWRFLVGGPVTVTSSQPVLASQRVQYLESFNEIPAA